MAPMRPRQVGIMGCHFGGSRVNTPSRQGYFELLDEIQRVANTLIRAAAIAHERCNPRVYFPPICLMHSLACG